MRETVMARWSTSVDQPRTRRAVDYVVSAVQRAPPDQIAVQEPGTLPQRKLGRNVDTYIAAQFLAEALATLPRDRRAPAEAALAECVRRRADEHQRPPFLLISAKR